MVKPVAASGAQQTHGADRAQGGRPDRAADSDENPFAQKVADAIEDGALSSGAIAELVDEVRDIDSPRERAHAARDLRRAVRENSDLPPQTIAQVNKALAHAPRAWAQGTHSTDEVASEEETPVVTDDGSSTPEDIEAPEAVPIQAASSTIRSDPTGLLKVGTVSLDATVTRRI